MTALVPVLRRRDRPGDEGVALLAVVISMTMLSLFLLTSLAYTLQNTAPARRDQDAKIAVAAAQAGLDEYVARLSANSNYWKVGNVDPANTAFSTGRSVPGTTGSTAGYRYTLLTTPDQVAQTGLIRLQVTGTSSPGNGKAGASRTLTATLQPRGFLSYIYLSDYEVTDPELNNTSKTGCTKYYEQGRASGCSNIQWTAVDVVNGPFHSNDALQINGGVRFLHPLTESGWSSMKPGDNQAPKWWSNNSYNGPLPGYAPKYAERIDIPEGNTELKTYTTPGSDGLQTGSGCYYTGATKITFTGARMKVLSPNTTSPKTPLRCLDVANRAQEQTVDIPPVVYVDRSPSSSCTGVGYPRTDLNETYTPAQVDDLYAVSSGSNSTTNYQCQRGTAFVQGTADAQVTVAALDDILVTGNLLLSDGGTGTDVLGLIAGNFIWVYHPVNGSGNETLTGAQRVTTIQAAILSLRHSFVVQNWGRGSPLGTLNVLGAIAQRFRGPVGTGNGTSVSTGYAKNYVYDSRLAYLQPPYFLKPISSPWAVSAVTDR